MEIFLIIALGIVLTLVISSFRKEVKKNMRIMNKNIINVRKEVEAIKQEQPQPEKQKATVVSKPKVIKPLEVSGQRLSAISNKPTVKSQVEKEIKPKRVFSEAKKPAIEKVTTATKPQPQPQPQPQPIQTETPPKPTVTKTVADDKKPKDYEKLIGENWLNKIGIAILVIGIGFFVKYAIDKNWIGEIGRVGIGVGTGTALMGIAHFLRKKYRAFSSVLIGGGISTLYYSIAIAYHDYALFSQTSAFTIMTGITLLSTALAVIYDRKELAIIALIGGFTSPFMVQNGAGNYVVFFTYITILNTGMLFLSYFKKWPIISKLGLGFTVLFFGAWMLINNMHNSIKADWAVIFATIFFVQFTATSLIYNFVKKVNFNAWEFIQISSISVLYYGAVLYVIDIHNAPISPSAFTLFMALFYGALALVTHLKNDADKALMYLLTGKAVALITIAGALLFDGNHITIFWAIEGVILLAVGRITKMKVLQNASIILTAITFISLIKDWSIYYAFASIGEHPIFNSTVVTGLVVIGSFVATYFILRKHKEENNLFIRTDEYKLAIGALVFVTSYFVILLELIYQLNDLNYNEGVILTLWIYHIGIILAGYIVAHLNKKPLPKQIFFFLGAVGVLGYLIFGQYNNFEILQDAIGSVFYSQFYGLHYLLTGLIITLIVLIRKSALSHFENKEGKQAVMAALSIISLVILTVEMDQIIGYVFGETYGLSTVLRHTRTEGYTILWGVYSFVLMMIGMRKKNRIIRIISLVLFSVTLIKLFAFDIQNISEAGKIVAFISLGVLLLIVSFLYQKLRTLIVEGKVD